LNESTNEWLPTHKGVTLQTTQIPDLMKGIEKASEEWQKEAETKA